MVWDQPSQKYGMLSENQTKSKSVGGMAQEAESLPNKLKALSSIPTNTKK
jgi:hypothetical protein